MAANFGKNQMVADTLDAYLQLEKPQFAVLLQGKWGSGKTWFIRNYIDKRKNENQPFCYVSLFGIEQLIEIDSQIIACCNPILSKAEGVSRFAGRIIERLNPAIKGDDIEKFAKFLKKWCKIHGNLVLVLDDLERASIQMELVLGYVSNMLEDMGIKVILLCDTEQFSENKKTFLRFREKVVGNSIAIEPDIETVFDSQVALQPEEIRKIFEANRSTIIEDFNISKTNNLRHIKRIIYQFLMCFEQMSPEMQKNEAFLDEFLHVLFMFSMEINKGIPKQEFLSKKEKIYTYYDYPQYYISIDSVNKSAQWLTSISSEFIDKFFYDGIIDNESLHNSYMVSEYADAQIIPFVLFNKFIKNDLDDEEAKYLYDQLKLDINNAKYKDAKIILYAFDIMLKFSQIGLEDKSGEDIVQLAKEYISKAEINIDSKEANDILEHNRFLTRNTPLFEEIFRLLCERMRNLYQEQLDDLHRQIQYMLPTEPENFMGHVFCAPTCPVKLTCLEAVDFAQRVSQVCASRLHNVLRTIFYNIDNVCGNSAEDEAWINVFYDSLQEYIKSMQPIARNLVNGFMTELYQLIQNKYQQKES